MNNTEKANKSVYAVAWNFIDMTKLFYKMELSEEENLPIVFMVAPKEAKHEIHQIKVTPDRIYITRVA